jgi:glycine cleavage system H protein
VDVPAGLRYSDDHEWLRADGSDGTVGITRYAADELGDVVFVEMPPVGMVLTRGETFGVIESVKTASDLYSPVAGEVVAVNEALTGAPETRTPRAGSSAFV